MVLSSLKKQSLSSFFLICSAASLANSMIFSHSFLLPIIAFERATLHHFKGTTEYHKTQDIIHVKQILGHKHTENTMVYINLEAAILQTTDDQFTVRVVEAPDEIKQLLEVGFEFVCEKKQSAFLQKVSLKNTGYLLET